VSGDGPNSKAKPGNLHPDDWGAGLRFRGKSLSIKSVSRAATADDVVPVCMAHNLRQRNADHRHRSRIDSAKTPLNSVLRGAESADVAAEIARNVLDEHGIHPARRDAIMAIELVMQPPVGADTPEFWAACLAWADSRYQHIVSATVHRDQARPHIHILVLAVADGRFAGGAMTKGANMFVHQRREFMAHMRTTLGLRPDRKVKSLSDLAVSAGRGPKTKAQADKRDAALVRQREAESRRAEVGMDVGGHGRPGSVAGNVHAHPKTPTSLLRSSSHVSALWSDLFENRKKAPQIAAVEPDEKAPSPAAARCLELADEDHGPDVSNAADVTEVESVTTPVTTPRQRTTRNRDDDHPAGTWSPELGEFVELPTTTKRTGRQEADAWVAAALTARGQDDRKPVTA
jgi:hypothetical protein